LESSTQKIVTKQTKEKQQKLLVAPISMLMPNGVYILIQLLNIIPSPMLKALALSGKNNFSNTVMDENENVMKKR
jgi:hypothetical protein